MYICKVRSTRACTVTDILTSRALDGSKSNARSSFTNSSIEIIIFTKLYHILMNTSSAGSLSLLEITSINEAIEHYPAVFRQRSTKKLIIFSHNTNY